MRQAAPWRNNPTYLPFSQLLVWTSLRMSQFMKYADDSEAQNQANGAPQAPTPRQQPTPSHAPPPGYPPGVMPTQPPSAPPQNSSYLPQPSSTGSVDLSSIKPASSGSFDMAGAIAKARNIAAEKGLQSYDMRQASCESQAACVPLRHDRILTVFSHTTILRRPKACRPWLSTLAIAFPTTARFE